MVWLNLTMSNQTVKNVLKTKKVKLPQMNFFIKKLFFSFIPQNFLKVPELWRCATFRSKMIHLSWTNFLWYKPLLPSTYWPFSLCKSLKKFLQWIQTYEDAPFLEPKWSICPPIFFLENYWYHSHLPISLFHFAKLFCKSDPELWGCAIFGPKIAHFPKWEFFRKPVNEPCFFHSCLPISQKSSQILIY